MKLSVVLALALLLCSGLAWAEAPAAHDATASAPQATQAPETARAAPEDGGGCMLPDLAGLSDEEARAALVGAGFDLSMAIDTAAPVCPTKFSCSSIVNCAAGSVCSLTDIGPCCTYGGGLSLCCLQGTIKVRRCPCRCTAPACALQCLDSTDVSWSCS